MKRRCRCEIGPEAASQGGRAIARAPRELLRHAHLGIQFVIILVLFVLGGSWLDTRLHTGGLLVLVGVFTGAAIGFYLIYRDTQKK